MHPDFRRIHSCLIGTGYKPELITEGTRLWNGQGSVPLLAHSRLPRDIRTSAIAVTDQGGLENVRATSAPYAIVLSDYRWEWWRTSGKDGAEQLKAGRMDALESFFAKHRQQLHPDAVYRAKTWGRMDPEAPQGEFIDAGLMPLVEREVGEKVRRLLEENVKGLATALEWTRLTDSPADGRKAEWLIKAPFWLLAAKILRDKGVPGFRRLSLTDLETVFDKLARHYQKDHPQPVTVPNNRRESLLAVAHSMDRFASLELMSTEALGYIYESTLINKATRKRLGTHSTPAWLIDYMVGRLRPWIAEMSPEGRHVFEPACGHCGFLVSALRLLDELRPDDFPEDRKTYLRRRLHGVDADPFSQEVARLALTLADVPNPNGWDLTEADIFPSDLIGAATRKAQIVLANPPFEPFKDQHQKGWLHNKAAETFARVIEQLAPGGVFGFVLPQGVLSSKESAPLRRQLLQGYEISEITLFADKVFEFGEPESVIILGRKLAGRSLPGSTIRYQRVRESDVGNFSRSHIPSSEEEVSQDDLNCPSAQMFVPERSEVWNWLRNRFSSILGDAAEVRQGFTHKNLEDLPKGTILESTTCHEGLTPGFAASDPSQQTHGQPQSVWLNITKPVIRYPRGGTTEGTPQVLLNYPPVSRRSWRLKALIDSTGRPVTSDFIVVRPDGLPLSAFWAILNSPLGNAFAFSHCDKWHNLVGKMREMPVPDFATADIRPLLAAAGAYLEAARAWSAAAEHATEADKDPLFAFAEGRKAKPKTTAPTLDELRTLHWRVDAEVMRLYGLPPELERKVLDLFSGVERRGVPFTQTEYFPLSFRRVHTMAELLMVTADWEQHAKRKSALIEKKVQRRATPAELEELKELKRLSGARSELLAPLPVAEWREIHAGLKQEIERTKK